MATEAPYTGGQLLDGFSFLPGELMPTAPYIFPGEAELVMFLELVGEYGGGWVGVVAEVIVIILELIDYLVSIFEGKPRAQDTLTVAGRLSRGQSPIAHIMSAQINRNLNQNNIVLSSSDPGDQKILGAIRKQAELSLVATGATEAEAIGAVDHVWSHTVSSTQKLPAMLAQPLPSGVTLVGNPAMQLAYANHYNSLIQKGETPFKAARKTTNWLYNSGKMEWLNTTIARINPIPPPIIPPPKPISPPTPIAPPPPPPGPAPQPCFPQAPGPYGDELTDGLGCVSQNLAVLAYWFPQIIGQLGGQDGNTDPVTCAQLTGLVNALADELGNIAVAIARATSGGGTPVDLTQVVADLSLIAAAITRIAGTPPAAPLDMTYQLDHAANEVQLRTVAHASLSAVADDIDAKVHALLVTQ